jgi:hypothetical protein
MWEVALLALVLVFFGVALAVLVDQAGEQEDE